jgi:hypothetical protein
MHFYTSNDARSSGQCLNWSETLSHDRFVCEAHPLLPWEGPRACGCGAPGDPCPVCNRMDSDTEQPELPEDFVVEKRIKD